MPRTIKSQETTDASKHRPGGQWSDDDYDVFDGDHSSFYAQP